jgi:hypothetical protein
MKNITAHTETNSVYPGYVSINDECDHVSISVRTRGAQLASTINMTRDQLQAMSDDIAGYLAATAPSLPEPNVSLEKVAK